MYKSDQADYLQTFQLPSLKTERLGWTDCLDGTGFAVLSRI